MKCSWLKRIVSLVFCGLLMALGVFSSPAQAQTKSGLGLPNSSKSGMSIVNGPYFDSLMGNPSGPKNFSFFNQRSFSTEATRDPLDAFDQLGFDPVESIFYYNDQDEIHDRVSFETLRMGYRIELSELDDPIFLHSPLSFDARERRKDLARDISDRELNDLLNRLPQVKRIRERLIPYSKAFQLYRDRHGFFRTDVFERSKRSSLSHSEGGNEDLTESQSLFNAPILSMNLLFSTQNSMIYKLNLFSQFSVSYMGDDRLRFRWSKPRSNFTFSYEKQRMDWNVFEVGYLF